MHCNAYRHNCDQTDPAIIYIVTFVIIFICCSVLLSLRLYALNIEHKIAETSGELQVYREKNITLVNECSKVMSPAKVYCYARKELGMSAPESEPVIYLDNSVVLVAKNNGAVVAENRHFASKFNPFVKRAHAKN